MKLSELKAKVDGLCDMGYGQLKVKLGSLHEFGNEAVISEKVNITNECGLERAGTITFEIDYTFDKEETEDRNIE